MEKGRKGLGSYWFLLSLPVTLNEKLCFPPFQQEGPTTLFLGDPGDPMRFPT